MKKIICLILAVGFVLGSISLSHAAITSPKTSTGHSGQRLTPGARADAHSTTKHQGKKHRKTNQTKHDRKLQA